jgi:hypothetical protein
VSVIREVVTPLATIDGFEVSNVELVTDAAPLDTDKIAELTLSKSGVVNSSS